MMIVMDSLLRLSSAAALAVVITSSTACHSPAPPPLVPAQLTSNDSEAVYAAILDRLYASTPESSPVVIVGDTLESEGGLSYGGRLFVKDSAGIQRETLADFEKVAYPRIGEHAATSLRDSPVPDADEPAVCAVALAAILPKNEPGRVRAGVFYRTVSPCVHSRLCGATQLPVLQSLGVVDGSTVSDFREKAAATVALRTDFFQKNHFDPITPGTLDFIRDRVRNDIVPGQAQGDSSDAFWNAFETAYPGSAGQVSFTRAGFNPSRSQSLVEITFETRGWKPHSELMLLQRSNGRWRVTRRHLELEKFSGSAADGRACDIVPAPTIDIPQALQPLEGLYRFEFVTDAGAEKVGERTVLFIPDSVSRREFKAIYYDGRGVHVRDPFPSPYGIPHFEVLYPNGKRAQDVEIGMKLFSGTFPLDRYRPAFSPDAVYLPGDDIEILDVRDGQLGGRWIQNDDSQAMQKSNAPPIRGQGHFCARKIAPYRSSLLK